MCCFEQILKCIGTLFTCSTHKKLTKGTWQSYHFAGLASVHPWATNCLDDCPSSWTCSSLLGLHPWMLCFARDLDIYSDKPLNTYLINKQQTREFWPVAV